MKKTERKNRSYSAEFETGVIMDRREHHLGYCETVRKYWDITAGQEDHYKNTVKRWERIFLEEGAEGLMKDGAELVLPAVRRKADHPSWIQRSKRI